MHISVKTLVIVSATLLAAGLGIGWLLFAGESKTELHRHPADHSETTYTCSMHPQIRQNEPGDCPICGMDLVPVSSTREDGIDPAAVSMSETAIKLANVVTMKVEKGSLRKDIGVSGKVQTDERLTYSQTAHFPGRIEDLKVNYDGEYVAKGAVLGTIYSPELLTAQEELLETFDMKNEQPQLYESARRKLKNWLLTEKQIDHIVESKETRIDFPIVAQNSGYVMEMLVKEGDHVNTGTILYKVANLSRVWVEFDIYESDLSWVSIGDSVMFSVSSKPGRKFKSSITYIDPTVDPSSRVAKARAVIANTNFDLKPEVFVSGTLHVTQTDATNGIIVPKSAVLWTGKRSVVYEKVQTDRGLYFRMREIELGPSLGDSYVVLSGIEGGEEIAMHGAFSIDAAAQLAGKPSMMSPDRGGSGSASDGSLNVNISDKEYDVSVEFRQQLKEVLLSYYEIKDALVNDKYLLAVDGLSTLKNAIEKVDMKLIQGEAHSTWMTDLNVLNAAISNMLQSKDIAGLRAHFSTLSDQLFFTLKKYRVEIEAYRQYCPMAFDYEGAYWISSSDEILNPYFGEEMLTCGNVEEEL